MADDELTIPPIIPEPPQMERTIGLFIKIRLEKCSMTPKQQEKPRLLESNRKPEKRPAEDEDSYRPAVVEEEQLYVPEPELQAISPEDEVSTPKPKHFILSMI